MPSCKLHPFSTPTCAVLWDEQTTGRKTLLRVVISHDPLFNMGWWLFGTSFHTQDRTDRTFGLGGAGPGTDGFDNFISHTQRPSLADRTNMTALLAFPPNLPSLHYVVCRTLVGYLCLEKQNKNISVTFLAWRAHACCMYYSLDRNWFLGQAVGGRDKETCGWLGRQRHGTSLPAHPTFTHIHWHFLPFLAF